MMDVTAASLDLAVLAAAGETGVEAYEYPPDKPEPPCWFVEEWTSDETEDGTPLGGGGAYYTFTLVLLVSLTDDREARLRRNALVKAAVESLSAGMAAEFSDLIVLAKRAPADMREFGMNSYVHAELDVQVFG